MELLNKASKKQLLQQLGSDPKAAEMADWLSKDVKRDDVQQWFLRNYKKNPDIYNDKNKEAVRHYVGTADIHSDKDIGKIRFDKSHSFEDGMKLWGDAENKLTSEKKGADNLLKPDEKTKKLIDLGHGFGWYDLGKGYDAAEGKAMSHCGNVNAQGAEGNPDHPNHHDRILSLRKEHNINGETYHEPRLSFIENQGHLGETKGFGNSKPAAKYHDAIAELLKHPRIKENIGGGYAPDKNFYLNDMPKDKLDKLLKDKPNLERLWKLSSGKVDESMYPQKHRDDAKLHNQALEDLNNGKENTHQARFRDIDPKYAKDLISKHIKSGKDNTGGSEDEETIPAETLAIMQSPHLDKSHIDEAFDQPITDGEPGVLSDLLNSHAANKEHISRALDHDNSVVRYRAIQSPHFKPEHMDKVLSDKDIYVRHAAVQSPHFKPEHIDKALNDKDELIRVAAVKSPHFKSEHFDKAFNDENESVRQAAANSPHFKAEHFDKAFNDENAYVREAAALSPHFGHQHMDKALNDESSDVRLAAVESPHFKPEHMDKAFNDKDNLIREAAIYSPHFKAEHMDKALSDNNSEVRAAAVQSPHFGHQHMDKALNDESEYVRQAAMESPHYQTYLKQKGLTKTSEVEHISDLLKAMLKSDKPNVRQPTPSQWKSLSEDHIKQMSTKWRDLIPKDHPDHSAMISHLNSLTTSGKIQDAKQLSDRFITGGGDWSKDKPMNKSLQDSSINIITYSDGTVDLEFGEDVSEALEKTAVEYLRSQGYDEILEKGLKAEHKSKKGGMTAAGVKAYRRENPGSKLQTAVAEKSPTGKRAKRRRSFCSRMSGVKGPMKDKKGRPTRKALALRRWRC